MGAYPRHFLYVLPLALVVTVRGAFVLAAWLAHRLPFAQAAERLHNYGGAALLGLVVLASLLSLVPYYQTPKQDYTGALAYIEARREPADVVAAVGIAATGYKALYAPNLAFPETVEELTVLRGDDHNIWVIYTFQRDMRIRFSDIYDYIQHDFTLVASFPGTVGDGTIWVARGSNND